MAEKKKTNTKDKAVSKRTPSRARKALEQAAAPPSPPGPSHHREILGGIFLALGAFMLISLFSTEGAFVAFFADLVKGLFGWGFWLTVPAFCFAAVILLFHKGRPVEMRVWCTMLLPLFFAAIAALAQPAPAAEIELRGFMETLYVSGKEMRSGGVLGGLLAFGLDKAVSKVGAYPMLIVAFLICLILAVRGTLSGLFVRKPKAEKEPAAIPEKKSWEDTLREELTEKTPAKEPEKEPVRKAPGKSRRPMYPVDVPLGEEDERLSLKGPSAAEAEAFPTLDISAKRAKVRRKSPEESAPAKPEPFRFENEDAQPDEDIIDGYRKLPLSPKAGKKQVALTTEISDPPKGKKISQDEVDREAQAVADAVSQAQGASTYEFPPIDLLRSSSVGAVDAREEIRLNGERLESALHSFGINAAIAGVTHGPTVTRYDIELEQGVKLSRVTNLAGDLALALGVINVRIAPIPDKISTVGIEVPNRIVSTVYLRDIIESPRFQTAKSKLSFAIGKDIGGDCIVGNIAKLPHMLIAGTTGSGKSVCMNSLILSLLYKSRPDEVRLIMIDPKMVELGVYNGIPHLYVPVVTDPKKAAGALQWAVVEMLKRYRSFSEAGVRDLESYNRHAEAGGETILPQVVIVIDELADLMLVASKEVEESICRVAQMGRAAGIHLVIATQRPSADVITGLMKANIPSRIAFAVSSAMESRIILDQSGAEKLVGMGDMLYSPLGSGKPTRIQGAFVSDEEREEVIQFVKEGAGEVSTNDEILAAMEQSAAEKSAAESPKGAKDEGTTASGYDEMLPQAVEAVLEAGSCSVSMLQRRVKLGYSRAARIVDQMEELGVVGPYEGAKPRAVVIDRAGWQALQVQLGLAEDDGMALAAQMSEGADLGGVDE